MMTLHEAIAQLDRSERGQMTCKLLHEFLDSGSVKFLDEPNQHAVAVILCTWMLGNSTDACNTMDALSAVIERNKWMEAK